MSVLLVALGAFFGAPCRYLVDLAVRARYDGVFPWGTLLVNLAGSFVLGVVLGAAEQGSASDDVTLLVGTGFCGAFTTFSTFVYETLVLGGSARGVAVLNVVATLAPGIGAAAAGWAVASAIW